MEHDDQAAAVNRVEGPVLGQSVQAGVIHGGVHFTAPPRRGQVVGEPLDEIRSLLRAQVEAAQDLPRLLPGARRPALADVYVRQDLGNDVADARPESPQPMPILDGRGQLVEVPGPPVVRIAVRPPVRTVREVLDGAEHLIVTGGAGQGKSTLSLRLAADVAVSWLDGGAGPFTERVVPLRLTARELAARLHLSFPEALADSVFADYGAFLRTRVSRDVLCEVLSGHVAGCRWLLLVDGLDEVAEGDDRDQLVKVLASCAAESPYRVLLTTRPIEGALLAPMHRIGAVRYELQAFDEEALRRFADSWFAEVEPGMAERFLRQIRLAHLEALVRVPLLATIAAIVFEQRSGLPLPDNQYELYEEYFSFLRAMRPTDCLFEPHRVDLLEHLGLVRVETDTSLVAAARDWVVRHVGPEHLPAGWADQLTAFLVAVGMLVVRGNDLTFLHHSFAEHLAATATARRLPATFTADHEHFARLLHAARPEERGGYARAVALHYTRLRPDQADPLLRSLHTGGAEQHLLAARLLAKRIPATTPVVDAFLETVRGWAMTTHHLGGEILSHACRATQHRALAAWLAGLMRDESIPWASRTEAAAALSVRLRDHHMPEATRFLRAVVDDVDATVEVRLAAAEALSDSGTAAEREAAARGLRSVLANPASTGADLRTAAVVLAAFDREARDFAVATLTRLIENRDSAPTAVVEAATGLVEIGADFHTRAAEAFRLVLHDRVHSEAARGDAALGMASLGPEHLAEAVAALTAVVNNRRRTRTDRVSAANVLGRLGPQHRQTAGESVRTMLTEPDIEIADIRYCTVQLAGFGPGFLEEAERGLRRLITGRGTPVDQVVWALNGLSGLGAQHVAEVAQRLWRLLEEIRPDTGLYTTVLDNLTDLGEPHRSAAVERLHALLADRGASAESRYRAASRLVDAGPELHKEVVRHLLDIVEAGAESRVVIDSWRVLVKLEPHYQARALDVLLRATKLADAGAMWFYQAYEFASTAGDRDRIADAMVEMAADPERTYRERFSALWGLLQLGPRFHRRAVHELCAMLRSVTTMYFDFRYAATTVAEMGIGLRQEVARVLVELMSDSRANVVRAYPILTALEVIGFADDEVALASMRMVVDRANNSFVRLDTQSMLIAVDPASAHAVADDIFTPEGNVHIGAWQGAVDQLARHGVDVEPRLRALITHPDTDARVRWASALCLCRSFPAHRHEAVDEMTRQLGDRHLRLAARSDMLREFAEIEPERRDQATNGHLSLLGNENLKIDERCDSAISYAKVDRSVAATMLALLERLADDSRLTPVERAAAVRRMKNLGAQHGVPRPWLLSVAALEAGTGELRTSLVGELPRELRTRTERVLLDDRVMRIDDRLPAADIWDDLPLASDAVTAIREVLTAPEFPMGERVEAAAALGRLDLRTIPEITAYLDGVPDDSPAARRAKSVLAWLRTARGWAVRLETERIALDSRLPLRQRKVATELVLGVTLRTPRSLVGVLREVVADPSTSERNRAEALRALGPFDGLDALRALRDDERATVSVRWYAAVALTGYQPEDRAAAARVLAAIASDPDERPALRWRAAKDLAYRGQAGRDQAIELLRALAGDARLPVSARARAAATLGDIAPSTRSEVLEMLRGLLSTDKPLLRRKVLLAIGEMRPEEAALELLAMARNTRHGPVPRVWCAEGTVRLWRECRDRAAVVVREVAADPAVPPHLRRRAACFLARWSTVCREEARKLIRELDRATATP